MLKTNRTAFIGIVLGFIAALTVTAFIQHSPSAVEAKDKQVVQTSPNLPPPSAEDFALTERISKVYNYVAKNVSASVVHITSTKKAKISQDSSPFDDDLMKRFFPNERFFRFGPQQQERQTGLGSGVIIDVAGYIVTNNHVVEGADEISIMLPDGREFTPKWVRTDPLSDLALIKIDADNLFALELADSDKVQVGDMVLAVGNPFGLDNTVTQGIVSYIGRGVKMGSINYSNYIQTDAAINPGNSGGPLVNLRGQIIGINSAIVSRTSSYAGIGFAIPSNMVKFVADQLKKSETVTRSYLGVNIQDVTPPFAQQFGAPSTKGALVGDVRPDTPASKAGLKHGDIILEFDGIQVQNSQHLQNLVAQTPPGTKVKLQVLRDRKTIEVPLVLEKMPKGFLAGKTSPVPEEPSETDQSEIKELGITVANLNTDLAQKYNYKYPETKGVVIVQIDPQGEGARLGLNEGDLIQSVQNQSVTSIERLSKMLSKDSLKKGVAMYVRAASGGARYVWVKVN